MGIADTERWRARGLLGIEVPRPYRTLVARTAVRRSWERTKDPAVWRDLVYLLLVFFPLAIATFMIAVRSGPSRLRSSRSRVLRIGQRPPVRGRSPDVDTLPEALACSLIGLVLLAVLPWILGLLVAAHS